MKKLLGTDEMIALVEGASDLAILEAQAALPRASSDVGLDWLVYGVKEGFYRTASLQFNGDDVATLFYSMDGRTLRINACHSRRSDLDLEDAFEVAFRRLAGDRDCLRVQFETKRGGAIKKAVKRGYEICGVILRRSITGVLSVETVLDYTQKEQQNQSGPSESNQQQSTQESATDQEVAADNGGIGLGADASGNTISVTTDDVNAIDANTQVTGEALEAGANESDTAAAAGVSDTNAALASNIAALQSANALAQSGLAASTAVSDTAIASNTDIVNGALESGEEDTHDTLEAAQGTTAAAVALGGTAIAAGAALASGVEATSTDDLDAALSSNGTATGEAVAASNDDLNSSINAILTGQASSNALVQSVVNSNTAALENSNTLAYETAAGATSQEGQLAGIAAGANETVGGFGVQSSGTGIPGEYILAAVAAIAVIGLIVIFKD